METTLYRDVETSGTNGYCSFRIPGMIVTQKGTILTYSEARSCTRDDWSTRAVFVRRSTDAGSTFSSPQIFPAPAGEMIGNPVMIAGKSGIVHFLYSVNMRTMLYRRSEDDGITFSEPKDITSCLGGFQKRIRLSLFGLGPGHGIELSNGRLVVPIWLCSGIGNEHHPTQVGVITSEDGGLSWNAGPIVFGGEENSAFFWPNETQAVEIENNEILFNIRHEGSCRYRHTCVSSNGIKEFSVPKPDYALPDPVCFGSICRSGSDILFVNCANQPGAKGADNRIDLCIRLSKDDGKTWAAAKLISKSGGYADIAASPDGRFCFCFFETGRVPDHSGDPMHLTLFRCPKEWLETSPQFAAKFPPEMPNM